MTKRAPASSSDRASWWWVLLAPIIIPLWLFEGVVRVLTAIFQTEARKERLARKHTHELYERVKAEGSFTAEEFIDATIRDVPYRGPLLEELCGLAFDLYVLEDFAVPEPPAKCNSIEGARYRDRLSALSGKRPHMQRALNAVTESVTAFTLSLPALSGDESGLRVSLVPDGDTVEGQIHPFFTHEMIESGWFIDLRRMLSRNLERLSPKNEQVFPRDAKDPRAYLKGTPLDAVWDLSVPFKIPTPSRFEHMHIVAGSGHGKTQILQTLIYDDLERVCEGEASVVVIDSQGDMINTITRLALFDPNIAESMASRLVLIDPKDIAHPPCLNLFDLGMERLERYDAAEREQIITGAIELYEYMFGALLGAELTQRQGLIFRYLARLMMVVPGATIHTMREFMEHPEVARPYIERLDGSTRQFFETQFFSSQYDDTRKQILTRLWGVISNTILDRMLSHKRNKVDLFDALNSGKIILVNTAKDLLKQDGCEILGRFFIAMIGQAAQERAAIPAAKRIDTFVYIDEAYDYFDKRIDNLLNQARKYRVGLTLAHQNLGQLERSLLATVMSSTSVKMAGGVSSHDATAFAREMRCDPSFVQGVRKYQHASEFACFVRHVTPEPVKVSIEFGRMERMERMRADAYAKLRELNRERYCSPIYSEREEEFVAEPEPEAPVSEPTEEQPSEARTAPPKPASAKPKVAAEDIGQFEPL